MDKENIFVTTDLDLWNSADEAYFFVKKGQVKQLPDVLTPIIEDALNQKLLREATEQELEKYRFEEDMEKALRNGIIKAGKNYGDTVAIYAEYLEKQNLAKEPKKEEPKKELPKTEKVDEKKPEKANVEPNKDNKDVKGDKK